MGLRWRDRFTSRQHTSQRRTSRSLTYTFVARVLVAAKVEIDFDLDIQVHAEGKFKARLFSNVLVQPYVNDGVLLWCNVRADQCSLIAGRHLSWGNLE